MSSSVDDHLPLKPNDFLILMTLAVRDRHGYGIVQDIDRQTDGQVRLVPGNLYAILKRLVDSGLISVAGTKATEGDQRRKYYQITPLGLEVLNVEAERLRQLVRLAERKRIIPGAAGAG